jgi:hypothetical protein
MDTLREEALNSQSARSDLLKWKLVLVGALGAVGLGLAGAADTTGQPDLVLCAIPPVCLYVDLLCRHLSLRILVIGSYFRFSPEPDASVLRAYETHADELRSAFALEDWAVAWSTLVLSIAVFGYGFSVPGEFKAPFFVSGALGVVVTVAAEIIYRRKVTVVRQPPGAPAEPAGGDVNSAA